MTGHITRATHIYRPLFTLRNSLVVSSLSPVTRDENQSDDVLGENRNCHSKPTVFSRKKILGLI